MAVLTFIGVMFILYDLVPVWGLIPAAGLTATLACFIQKPLQEIADLTRRRT
jgi:hypothetical protein